MFKAISSTNLTLLNFNEDDHPIENVFFWSDPYKIEAMKTSFIDMLELPNFAHTMTTSAI